jgi:hypothetical protein
MVPDGKALPPAQATVPDDQSITISPAETAPRHVPWVTPSILPRSARLQSADKGRRARESRLGFPDSVRNCLLILPVRYKAVVQCTGWYEDFNGPRATP